MRKCCAAAPRELRESLAARAAVKGEITLIVGPPARQPIAVSGEEIDAAIAEALATMPASRAAAEIARRFGLGKKEVYARILALKAEADA